MRAKRPRSRIFQHLSRGASVRNLTQFCTEKCPPKYNKSGDKPNRLVKTTAIEPLV